MGLMSFDAKDFDRPTFVEVPDPTNPEKVIKQNKGFYTPLGIGVLFKNEDLFHKAYIETLQEYLDLVYVSYVILPPSTIPTVTVGGTKSQSITINTSHFLRNLSPMFSYITAWNFMRYHKYSGGFSPIF